MTQSLWVGSPLPQLRCTLSWAPADVLRCLLLERVACYVFRSQCQSVSDVAAVVSLCLAGDLAVHMASLWFLYKRSGYVHVVSYLSSNSWEYMQIDDGCYAPELLLSEATAGRHFLHH